MSDSECPMPTPGPEHAWLAQKVGTWDVQCSMSMGPGKPPMEFTAVDVAEMVGPFWLRGKFTCEMFGAKYTGQAMVGYDSLAGKWLSSWIHSIDPTISLFEGKRDEATKTLEFRGTGLGPLGPGTKFRSTEVEVSPDEHVFTMYFELPDGSEAQMLQYKYRRRK